MQLVAYGAQDIYLTGNPQITFFKVVYRRHTNFSMESIEQTWNGTSNGANGRCTATISRNGDLVHKMYLELAGAAHGTGKNNPGSWVINTIELEIGGQKIDKQSGTWMEVWSELTVPNHTGTVGFGITASEDIGTSFQRMSGMGGITGVNSTAGMLMFVPLQFWFCRNPGLSLPLIALQYHEVKVILDHRMADVFASGDSNKLWVDYIYLDTDERRRFAQVSHEYLIEQVQEQSLTTSTSATSDDLNFNHPVKELIWTLAPDGGGGATDSLGSVVTSNDIDAGVKYGLKLNGHERFAPRDARYFTRQQVYDYHTGPGGLNSNAGASTLVVSAHNDSIAIYSFALKPEEHQPSGTCNFSRIDNAQLNCTNVGSIGNAADKIYAVNYNVLRIMSGMGGLAYSN